MKLLMKIRTLIFYFKPRKIVAQYKLFYGDEWLDLSVKSIAPSVHKILFVVSNIPWGEKADLQGDDLSPIINKLKTQFGDKIIVYKGSWNKQYDQVQAGLNYIKNYIQEATHCLYIDSDEYYTRNQIKSLKKLLYHPFYFNNAIRINYHMYFKSVYFMVVPENWPTALVLFPIRKYTRFVNPRGVNCGAIDRKDLYYEHFAYVRKSNERIRDKIEAHKETEKIITNWYNDVWLKWTPQMKNFHPTKPEFWEKVIRINAKKLPNAVIDRYKQWSKD